MAFPATIVAAQPAGSPIWPPEGFEFYVLEHWGMPKYLAWAWFFVFVCLSIAAHVLLRRRDRQASYPAWLPHRPAKLIFLIYLFLWWGFAFLYDALFQTTSTHFTLNARTAQATEWQAIEEHQRNIEKARECRAIIATTLSALRTNEGSATLASLAHRIRPDIANLYTTCLSLSIIGQPSKFDVEEAELISRLVGEPGKTAKVLRTFEEVRKTRPGIISPIPAWNAVKASSLEDIISLRAFLMSVLDLKESNPKALDSYLTTKDTANLTDYMANNLVLVLQNGERVDLEASHDALTRELIHERAALSVAVQKLGRLVDFFYITPLITGFRVGIFPEKQEDTDGTESFEGAVARVGRVSGSFCPSLSAFRRARRPGAV